MLGEVNNKNGSVRTRGDVQIPIFWMMFSADIHDEVYVKMRTLLLFPA